MDYHPKYLKYKNKYHKLKISQHAGNIDLEIVDFLSKKMPIDDKNKIILSLINKKLASDVKYIKFSTSVFESICDNKSILHYFVLAFCSILENYTEYKNILAILFTSILYMIMNSENRYLHILDNEGNTPFNYLEKTSPNIYGTKGIYMSYYLTLFNVFAPSDYKFMHTDILRTKIIITCIINCYTEAKKGICNIISKIYPHHDNYINFSNIISVASKYNDFVIINELSKVIPNPNPDKYDYIQNLFFNKCMAHDTLKYVVSYHGITHSNLFMVPKGICIIFLAHSGMFGYNYNNPKNSVCEDKNINILNNYAPMDVILNNYNILHSLHFYDQYNAVPNIKLSTKINDYIARGVISFENANKDKIELYENMGDNILIKKFNDPYFGDPIMLSDIVTRASILHKETGRQILLVVSACRVCRNSSIVDSIIECNSDLPIFNKTSFQHFLDDQKWKKPFEDKENTFIRIFSGSLSEKSIQSNFFDDITNMLEKIENIKVRKIISDFFNKIQNGEPFSYKKLCTIYTLGYYFTMGHVDDKTLLTTENLQSFIPPEIYDKYIDKY